MTAIIKANALPIPVDGSMYNIAPAAIRNGMATYTTNIHSIPNANPIFADIVGYLFKMFSPLLNYCP